MSLLGRDGWFVFGAAWLAGACGNGGTTPPGPPIDLAKTGGDGQNWYFNNPLPTALSATALDADGRAVPGVVVTWSVGSGGGGVNPTQSTTNASGVATTIDSVGSSTIQTVNATFTGLPGPVTFTEAATAPPKSPGVDIVNTAFNPASVVVQVNDSVTWTWGDSPTLHNVTYTAAPGALPPNSTTKATGTFSTTFTQVGTYRYVCTLHAQMNNGVVTVVH